MLTRAAETWASRLAALFLLCAVFPMPACNRADAATYGRQIGSGSSGTGLTAIPGLTTLCNPTSDAGLPIGCTPTQIQANLNITPYSTPSLVPPDIIIRAQALCGPSVNVCIGTEFKNAAEFVAEGGLGASIIRTLGGAVARTETGTGFAVAARMSLNGSISTFAPFVTNYKTQSWYAFYRIRFPSTIDASSEQEARIADSNGGNSSFQFGIRPGQSTTFFSWITVDSAGTRVQTTTSAAIEAASFHDVEFYKCGTGQPMNAVFDGAQVGTIADASLPAGGPLVQFTFNYNGSSLTDYSLDHDRMWGCGPKN